MIELYERHVQVVQQIVVFVLQQYVHNIQVSILHNQLLMMQHDVIVERLVNEMIQQHSGIGHVSEEMVLQLTNVQPVSD